MRAIRPATNTDYYTYGNTDTHTKCNFYGYCYADSQPYTHRYAYGNIKAQLNAKSKPNAEISSGSRASPLGLYSQACLHVVRHRSVIGDRL